jgi:hypothetical protein
VSCAKRRELLSAIAYSLTRICTSSQTQALTPEAHHFGVAPHFDAIAGIIQFHPADVILG